MHLRPSNPLISRNSPTTLEAARPSKTCLQHSPLVRSSSTTLQGCTYDPQIPLAETRLRPLKLHPATLQERTYDPQIPLSEAHLRPSKPRLRPCKVAPTTLKSPCQKLAHNLAVTPTTLQERTYDPQIPLSGAYNDLFELWPLTELLTNAKGEVSKRKKSVQTRARGKKQRATSSIPVLLWPSVTIFTAIDISFGSGALVGLTPSVT